MPTKPSPTVHSERLLVLRTHTLPKIPAPIGYQGEESPLNWWIGMSYSSSRYTQKREDTPHYATDIGRPMTHSKTKQWDPITPGYRSSLSKHDLPGEGAARHLGITQHIDLRNHQAMLCATSLDPLKAVEEELATVQAEHVQVAPDHRL